MQIFIGRELPGKRNVVHDLKLTVGHKLERSLQCNKEAKAHAAKWYTQMKHSSESPSLYVALVMVGLHLEYCFQFSMPVVFNLFYLRTPNKFRMVVWTPSEILDIVCKPPSGCRPQVENYCSIPTRDGELQRGIMAL